MTRDYSQFLPSFSTPPKQLPSPLEKLGWQPYFAQQLGAEEFAETPPVRVVEVHRNGLRVLGVGIDQLVPPGPEATVGDWLLLNRAQPSQSRCLTRKSLFARRAPGSDRRRQLIVANVDTAFVVTSCNHDFNVARLERYLALAFEAQVAPVIVLTKADTSDDPAAYVDKAHAVSSVVPVVALNALEDTAGEVLADWCKAGQTVAFLGSSGVGKSTLVNRLIDGQEVETAPVREDDSKGRHTTTRRQLHLAPGGCAVLDTPGMRELQLSDVSAGIDDVFPDLSELAVRCRFRDCEHKTEPGCAVLQAVVRGEVDASRLERWRKLVAEERLNSATLAERRADGKSLAKFVRSAQRHKKR